MPAGPPTPATPQALEDLLLEPAGDAWYGLPVSLLELAQFSGGLADALLAQPRAALRLLSAAAVAAQAALLQRGALVAACGAVRPRPGRAAPRSRRAALTPACGRRARGSSSACTCAWPACRSTWTPARRAPCRA